jgi:hypothetical protein
MKLTEEEGVIAGLRKLEKEAAFGKYAKAAQAGMGHMVRTSRLNAGSIGPNFMEGIPSEFKLDFWILPRLWKIAQRDLGGIWTWGFFLYSSRLLKDFRKIQYAMSRNAS